MRVVVASIEDPEYDFRMGVTAIAYTGADRVFSIPRPIGDDWLQRINHRPAIVPELVRIEGNAMFVLFHSRNGAQEFAAWLESAAVESQDGFRSMRG